MTPNLNSIVGNTTLTWTTELPLPGTVYHSQAIVTQNRVYLLGGYINDTPSSTVYTAAINADGTLDAWTTASPLPATICGAQAIVTKDRVYLLGGIINGAYSSTVYTAPIQSDGTLGTWTTATSLPVAVAYSQALVTKNRVYLMGGVVKGGYSSVVYTAPINADGTLGTWARTTSLPATIAYSQALVTKDRVYLLGGIVNTVTSSTVYTAPIDPDGTLDTWTAATSLPGTVYASQAIATKDRVYLLGGINNNADSSTVYTAPIAPDGTLGTWVTATPLPSTVYASQAIVTKDWVYLLGGHTGSADSSTVYKAFFGGEKGLTDLPRY
jgi:N-acetylneuraminic acid mutarotase